jgi:hypothetical protein
VTTVPRPQRASSARDPPTSRSRAARSVNSWLSTVQTRRKVIAQPLSHPNRCPDGRPAADRVHPVTMPIVDSQGRCWSDGTQAFNTDGSAEQRHPGTDRGAPSTESDQRWPRPTIVATPSPTRSCPSISATCRISTSRSRRPAWTPSPGTWASDDATWAALLAHRRAPRRHRRPDVVHHGLLGAAGLVAIKERHPRRPSSPTSTIRSGAATDAGSYGDSWAETDAVICVSGPLN